VYLVAKEDSPAEPSPRPLAQSKQLNSHGKSQHASVSNLSFAERAIQDQLQNKDAPPHPLAAGGNERLKQSPIENRGALSIFSTTTEVGPRPKPPLKISQSTVHPIDIISTFALAPVPCLGFAFATLKCIWSSIQGVQLSKQQLGALATSVDQFLRTLDGEIRSGRLVESQISPQLRDLQMSVVASLHCPSLIDFKAPERDQVFR
jgi:hypothetical protein